MITIAKDYYESAVNHKISDFLNPNFASTYLHRLGLLDLLEPGVKDGSFSPVFQDLARLHYLVLKRRALSLLEFGTGWSTLVAAHAMWVIESIFKNDVASISRRDKNFHVHTLDESIEYSELAKSRIPSFLRSYATFHTSRVEVGLHDGRLVTRYTQLPDISPDFIYLDGPSATFQETGSVSGLTMTRKWRMPCSADLLSYEYQLESGALILIDGRTTNARFLRDYLRRNWVYEECSTGDISILELQEPPIGGINEGKMRFCLRGEWTLDALPKQREVR
jgi:hypothetical protein